MFSTPFFSLRLRAVSAGIAAIPLLCLQVPVFAQDKEEANPEAPKGDEAAKAYLITKAKSRNEVLSTFVNILEAAGLVDSLVTDEPFTAFMPTNAAFDKLEQPDVDALIKNQEREKLKEFVQLHMVKGALTSDQLLGRTTLQMENGRTLQVSLLQDAFTVGGAAIIESDIICKNGVIHIMEGVIQPEMRPVMKMARVDGRFWKFLDAAKASGIAPMLSAKGDYTVFAPTDAAFEAISKENMKYLVDPRNKSVLLEMLRRHVVRGQLFARDLKKKSEIRAMAGNVIPVAFVKAKPTLDGAGMVVKDIISSNGVIHGIDKVLLPEIPEEGKPRSIKVAAAALIGQAVQNAVPLFNSGQVDAVAALFQQTADSILQLGREGMPAEAIKAIEEAIPAAAKAEDGHDKSWELRKGLDKAFEVLTK